MLLLGEPLPLKYYTEPIERIVKVYPHLADLHVRRSLDRSSTYRRPFHLQGRIQLPPVEVTRVDGGP